MKVRPGYEKEMNKTFKESAVYDGTTIEMVAAPAVMQNDLFSAAHTKFNVMLSVDGRKEVFDYQLNLRYSELKLDDIMECLLSDYYTRLNVPDALGLMEEFGYEDPKEARRIFKAIDLNKDKMDNLFGGQSEVERINAWFQGETMEEEEDMGPEFL